MPDEEPTVEPFPFATLAELKARWPDFPLGADAHAETLLEDASQFILDTVPSAAQAHSRTRRMVVCNVVRRSMETDADLVGLESSQMGAGPYQETRKALNPHGDFYLTKQEKTALGADRKQVAFTVGMGGNSLSHLPWCSIMFGGSCSCGAALAGHPIYEGGEDAW